MNELASYIGNKDQFPSLAHWDFFNHAGASPLPRVVAQEMRRYVDETEQAAYLIGNRYAQLDVLRLDPAKLINASGPDEIAHVKNTAEGLSIVAHSIDWKPGDRIVTAAGEYPANVYPWMEQSRAHGVELVMVPEITDAGGRRFVPLDELLKEAAHPRTRIVTLSHVEFGTGQRHDLARIGAFCRANGKLFCVDAIQSLGAVPVDVQAMNIDFLATGGQKWLLGPEGSAFFYCRRDLIAQTRPLIIGAVNVVNFMNFGEYDYTLQPTAGRFESGTYNIAGLWGCQAAMKLLLVAGPASVAARIKQLTDRLCDKLAAKGYTVVSPRTGDQWSGIVSFTSSSHDHNAIAKTLRKEHKTEVVVRNGRLRASPHFYMTEAQIDRLVEHLPAH